MDNENKDEAKVANQLADLAAVWMKEAKEKMAKEEAEAAKKENQEK